MKKVDGKAAYLRAMWAAGFLVFGLTVAISVTISRLWMDWQEVPIAGWFAILGGGVVAIVVWAGAVYVGTPEREGDAESVGKGVDVHSFILSEVEAAIYAVMGDHLSKKNEANECGVSSLERDAHGFDYSKIAAELQLMHSRAKGATNIEIVFSETRSRLAAQVDYLSRRGSLSLLIGLGLAVSGLIFIVYFVVFDLGERVAWTPAEIIEIGSRVSFLILLELLAFFFLRLYRQSLADVRYFINELTNLDAMNIGVALALGSLHDSAVVDASTAMFRIERNVILKGGETTVDIERERIAAMSSESALSLVREIVAKFDKKDG